MKILHVGDMASISGVLSKYLRHDGFRSKILQRRMFDSLGSADVYDIQYCWRDSALGWLGQTILNVPFHDIIHIHSLPKFAIKLRRLFPGKKLVLHYHGSDVMYYKDGNPLLQKAQDAADMVIVAAPDLLERAPDARYLPIIVDTDRFKPSKHVRPTKNALTASTRYLDMERMAKSVRELGGPQDYDILDRETDSVPHSRFPEFLQQYRTYIDIRHVIYADYTALKPSYSTTALQAMACGLSVFDWEGRTVAGLPEIHKPENVARQLAEWYAELRPAVAPPPPPQSP